MFSIFQTEMGVCSKILFPFGRWPIWVQHNIRQGKLFLIHYLQWFTFSNVLKLITSVLINCQAYSPQNLLLYYDSDHQWPAVYKSNKVIPWFTWNILLLRGKVFRLTLINIINLIILCQHQKPELHWNLNWLNFFISFKIVMFKGGIKDEKKKIQSTRGTLGE